MVIPQAGRSEHGPLQGHVAGRDGHGLLLNILGHHFNLIQIVTKQCQIDFNYGPKAGKQPIVSLFSGIGGLDLGLSSQGPRFTSKGYVLV